MDLFDLKKAAEAIEMPADMRVRIAETCRNAMYTEETLMHTKKIHRPRLLLIATVLALCIALPITGTALMNSGFFRDVTNWQGAVTGTVYEQAVDEIAVTVSTGDGALTVETDFQKPEAAPYFTFETFALGAYEILDAAGNVIAEGTDSKPAIVADGGAVLTLPFDETGAYTLVIQNFVGGSKADQPLPLNGPWKIEFQM